MCKHLNKTKRDEEDEEVEGGGGEREGEEEGGGERGEEGHSPDTSHQLDDNYLQQQNGDNYDDDAYDDDAKEVNSSTMTSNRSKTANPIQRSTNEIVDSSDNCSFTRSAVNLTNTDYTSSSTKFTINEILKPDFGICKVRRVRHQRPSHENVTLLSYPTRPQVISLGSTGRLLIPISHYAPSIYSSTSCMTPTTRLASPLTTPPVTVQVSGSSSSLITSSPLSSSSSSPSLVRYGSDPITPSSLGLHHHQQQQSASSSSTFHSFTETRQHRSRHRPHQHLQNRGSAAVTYNNNQNNLNHSHRNQHHNHVQHGSNHRREEGTHQQHPHMSSRNQPHQLQQHHSSSNNLRRIDRGHFLDPAGSGSSDLTTQESNIRSNPSATPLAIATTTNITINHDDGDDEKKATSRNDSVSNELNQETNEPSANTATLYEGAASFVWPAWVYCTRYSDRPSSGPRSRKLKKRDRSADEKRPRTSFTSDQLLRLKQEFDDCRYLTEDRRKKLARELSLSEAQIKIWFQNKRAKIKKSSGMKNPLALHLMAQGLYNHSTVSIKDEHYTNEATF